MQFDTNTLLDMLANMSQMSYPETDLALSMLTPYLMGNLYSGYPENTVRNNPYQREIDEAAYKYNLHPDLIAAVMNQESQFNPRSISPKGAVGLMQLMPDTATAMGVDPYDPYQNIMGGAKYLRYMMDKFGSPEMALAAYNAGPGAVSRYRGIPPYKETQNYVTDIMGSLNSY